MSQFTNTFNECMINIKKSMSEFPWENKTAYAQWIRESYEYAFNSTRILAGAASVMPAKYTKFSNRFVSHAAEETGHEKLFERDIHKLGFELKDFEPGLEAKLFHQSLYYWLSAHGNVMGIFGWVLALEGAAVHAADQAYERAKAAHGAGAATFLRVHSDEDPDHLDKAFKAIEEVDEADLQIIVGALVQYADLYTSMLNRISLQHNSVGSTAA